MRVQISYHDIPMGSRAMRTALVTPEGDGPFPGILFYSDIFQLTESTLRWVSRLASYGFAVAAPEIYYRMEEPGTVLTFDDAGKEQGLRDVGSLTTAQFDEDITGLAAWLATRTEVDPVRIGAAGHCTGGHLAFRAAFDPRVRATACWYPTGLAGGVLGSDKADSLDRLEDIGGDLLLIFGGNDPHTPPETLAVVKDSLDVSGVPVDWVVVPGAEHAFGRDVGPRWDPAATDAALATTIEFFTRVLERDPTPDY